MLLLYHFWRWNSVHIGTGHFFLYKEVVLLRRLKCTSIIGLGRNASFFYVLFGVSLTAGSTV